MEDIKKKEDVGPKGRRIKEKCFAYEEQGHMKEDCPKQLVQTQATPTTVKQILP